MLYNKSRFALGENSCSANFTRVMNLDDRVRRQNFWLVMFCWVGYKV